MFFLLVIFLWLSSLVYTPGVRVKLDLPVADNLPGTTNLTVSVAIDADGRLYYDNQPIVESALTARLKQRAKESPEPLTLVLQADKAVSYDSLVRLTLLARDAGIRDALLATLPRPLANPANTLTP